MSHERKQGQACCEPVVHGHVAYPSAVTLLTVIEQLPLLNLLEVKVALPFTPVLAVAGCTVAAVPSVQVTPTWRC